MATVYRAHDLKHGRDVAIKVLRPELAHRDIKPENILLERGHAVVADFGIARAVAETGSERLTQTGFAVGTPLYMSPEQAVGEPNLDGRSDLYSLGCVLHEMPTGHPPFPGETVAAITQQHLLAEPPRVTTARGEVPASVEHALVRVLSKDPAQRPWPASCFVEALTSAEAISAAPARVAAPSRARNLSFSTCTPILDLVRDQPAWQRWRTQRGLTECPYRSAWPDLRAPENRR
jgi:serine/threonine-protein kinase